MTLDPKDLAARLYTAVLSDVLDEMGHMNQALRSFVRPLDDGFVMCGFARTGLYRPVYAVEPGRNPYEIEMDLVDGLKPGEVCVLACGGPTERIAPWGELLTTAAWVRGAAGCLTDGLVRDVRRIREIGFPVFCGGIGPLDTKGRAEMAAMDVAVEVAGVRIEPGDLIFGDADGCVAIPHAIAQEAVGRALEKVSAENRTRDALLEGTSLREVFERFGVL
ncbi:RraA family protein [Salinarimonas soli]|uniref:Putative 4-hydroxy-4-methyl-2-oxoglutarate aldolase n=1 Tax=Salinarimonas soli TaxID=1638099 RepID=A0A5B2V7Z4_9HYPH|nr:RraA family protein [Salinarimonas soli]KAA2235154.1 RraA family protein [Salinarimonas soli]